MHRWSPLILLLAAACEPAPDRAPLPTGEPESPAATSASSIAALFPLAPGDRWREEVAGARRTRGVTAVASNGVVAVLAQADRRPSLFAIDDAGASLVTPERAVLEPVLRGPLQVGASFSYAMGEGAQRAPCEATVDAVDAPFEVAGATLTGCLALTRRCRHPAAGPFAEPTLRTTEETFCPGVGRVRSRTTLSPPLPGASGPVEARVVRFQTSAGPALPAPEAFGCDAFLLLPSDVAAACGPEWSFGGERAAPSGCAHTFSTPAGGALEVRAVRRGSAEDAAATLADVRAERGEAVRAFAEGAVVIQLEAHASEGAPGCAAPERLEPLLRSLVRAPDVGADDEGG